jgi:phosphoserine aminotransferase
MKNIYFTVGPSQLYPTVKKHINSALENNISSITHRGSSFEALYLHTTSQLRLLLNIPNSHNIYFVSSGTECMERVIENTVQKDSFHFVNGSFSKRFYETAHELGKNPQIVEVPWGESFDFNKIKIPVATELICFTHNETSTGVMIPLNEIYGIKKKNPKKIIAMDVVSSAPYVNVDYTKVDIVFFSVQKGFGLPAGLSVLIVSPMSFEKSMSLDKKGISTGSYHSFKEMQKYALKNQTPETPNVLDIYLLGKVAEDMNKIGIINIRSEIEEKSEMIEEFIKESDYSYLAVNKQIRSKTIHVVKIPEGSKVFIEKLKKKGIVISSGYKDLKETHVRIANFPAHSIKDIKKLLQSMA